MDGQSKTSLDSLVFPQEDEIKHVIVSDSETIQSIDNQNKLQGVDMRSNSLAPCGRADLRTDGEKRVRIASRLRILLQSNMYETLRAWSKSKTGQGEGLKAAFTEPSRGMSVVKVEQTSAETLSFRCVCERCRLMRGDVGSKRRKVAFTLAEVLITLGIIGVVAALTLPSVIQNYREKEYAIKLKRFYSEMENASRLVADEYGAVDTWRLTYSFGEDANTTQEEMDNKYKSIDLFWSRYMKYLGGEKTPPTNKYIYGMDKKSVLSNYSGKHGWYALKYGIVVRSTWLRAGEGCTAYCGDFSVDLDGDKGPNSVGRDIFFFYITNKGIQPSGLPSDVTGRTFPNSCQKDNVGASNGYGCTAWVIYNENMDYLHCNGLSWAGKTKCKN